MWPQLVCCALALKNLMSVNLGLVEDFGARWSKVEESGATWESSEQCGKVRSNVEECKQIWRGLEMLGASVEKGYVFYFDYKLEFCPEATKLLYKMSEIPE